MNNDSTRNISIHSAHTLTAHNSRHSLASTELALMDAAGITSGKIFHTLRPSVGPVSHVCLSKDGALLAVASKRYVFLFRTSDWHPVGVFEGHSDTVTCTCICTQRGMLFSGSMDGTVRVWDLALRKEIRLFQADSSVTCLHADPDHSKLVLGCSNGLAKIIDIESGISEEFRHTDPLTEVFHAHDEWLLAETCRNVYIWDLKSGNLAHHYAFPFGNGGTPNLSLPAATMSVNEGDKAVLVDLVTGRWLREFRHTEGTVNSVFLTSDGRFLATGGSDNEARLWNREGDLLAICPHSDPVNSVQISDDSHYMVTGSEDTTVGIWKLTGEPIKTLESDVQGVVTLLLLPNGRDLVVGGYKGAAVYNLETGQREYSLGPQDHWTGTLSTDADGQRLAASFRNGTVLIWDLKARRPLSTLTQDGKKLYAQAITPEGTSCFTGSEEGEVCAWDLGADASKPFVAKEFPRLHTGWVRSIVVNPGNGLLATGGWDGRVVIWWPDGRVKVECNGEGSGIYSVAFDPTGSLLASSDNSGLIRIWDLDGNLKTTLFSNQLQVKQVHFIGKETLLTAGFDGSAQLWDTTTGQCRRIFDGGHEHPWVRSAIISPDGSRVITGGKDGRVCFWQPVNGELLACLHHLESGFLWTTPPDDDAPAGWFWTNRTDMLEIRERTGDEGDSVPVVDEHKRQAYIAAHHNRIKIVSQLRASSSHKDEHFSRLLEIKRANRADRQETKRLTLRSGS